MAPTLGYWNIRGLAHSIRMVLKYKEVEFVNKMYECADAPDYKCEEWLKEKFNLGLDLPNLPYYVDGDLKLTETVAILWYLGRKLDLVGSTEEAKVRNDMAYSFSLDNRYALLRMCYNKDFEKLKVDFLPTIPDRMEKISNFLGPRNYFAGDEITISDFAMYDVLDIYRIFDPTCITKENLKKFMERIEALPTIRAYIESDEYMKMPITLKMAVWGSQA